MISKKFCLFDQDEQALFEFDSTAEFTAQIVKIAVDEKRRGACYLLVLKSEGYRYFGGVYGTCKKAEKQIRELKKYIRKMQSKEGSFGFKFADDVEITPLILMEIVNGDKAASTPRRSANVLSKQNPPI